MSTKRAGLGVAVLDGLLYAVGRGYDVSTLNSVEKYGSITNQWRIVQSMSTNRMYLGVVAHDGLLYAVGGSSNGSTYLNSVEKHDFKTNQWSSVSSMSSGRMGLAFTVLDGDPCVVGEYGWINAMGGRFT